MGVFGRTKDIIRANRNYEQNRDFYRQSRALDGSDPGSDYLLSMYSQEAKPADELRPESCPQEPVSEPVSLGSFSGSFAEFSKQYLGQPVQCQAPVNLDAYMAYMDSLDGHAFEEFCAKLLRGNGFSDVYVTRGSGDQGVDIIAKKDGVKYAVQCKHYASALGNTPVQEIYAGCVHYHCHVAVVMTNSTFTNGAVELAESTGVLLWDRLHLRSMVRCAMCGPLL